MSYLDTLTREEQLNEAYNLADEVEVLKDKVKELKRIIEELEIELDQQKEINKSC